MTGPRQGAITEQDKVFVETWRNIATHATSVIRLDMRGDEKHELIIGDRDFYLTTEERLITEDRVLLPEDNPFQNGDFRPVVVPETVNIESNPNALDDEQIRQIFTASDLAWDEWLKNLTSPATLGRMLALAEDAEISLKRYKQVEARYRDVSPLPNVRSNDPHLRRFLDDSPSRGDGAVPVKSPDSKRGGRSADYR